MKTAIFMPVILLTAAMAANNAVADMYKWTDKNGVTHYTQTPPPPEVKGENIEDDIRLSTGKLGNTIPSAPEAEPQDELEKARKEGEKSDQKHRDFCAQQNDALQKMAANALIKWKDAQGERFLTAEEKTAKTKEIQGNIDSLCKPEMFNKTEKTTSQTEKAVDARLNTDNQTTSEVSQSTGTSSASNEATGSGSNTTNQAAAAMLPATD
ncbi:DUF4124 domain-containing protein [Thiothrix winogradskyi]|uniref:DUF4124 domain-containing protein n=1 Tax=Thiothrix winogradskyi TaxID=96472 RepID=A0ABY3SVK2_9GAMM|nr:DUF4124 domain-containing protein [Thiothrix winogradskyi]UJS23193.1 DUF4124 domain-containing protein [Thiothrix winogradskyi]